MAIKLAGEFTVTKSPGEVYDFLTDPNRFAPLLPEFQGLTMQDERHFIVKVNVGVSYIKGAANVKLELTEAERPRRAQYKGQGAVAGGSVIVTASFDLSANGDAKPETVTLTDPGSEVCVDTSLIPSMNPGIAPLPEACLASNGDGTKVNWQGEAQVFGPLASAAGGLLEPLGKKQVQKLIDSLQKALV
ncbi:MAG TPA: SRPBCC domain-containing protein [Terriglobales bacterium]|nr:SRPBCC domain-containing protein [Terriglobales bacterium]